jgi:hypothetical protein
MTHQHEKEEENYDFIYYLVGLLSGLFTGAILYATNASFMWVPVLGIFGLLFTAFFLKTLVKGREDA